MTIAACGSSSPKSASAAGSGKGTIRVAVVSNSNIEDIEKLTPEFESLNPGIKVVYDTLNENNERSLIETDITTHANEFNVVMISNYETPIWAKNGWLVNLSPRLSANPKYDVGDLLKPIASSLSYNGSLYGVPFYGESSMVYYRKDLFKAAGLTMPLHPTWAQIASFAAKLNNTSKGIAGICLRGQTGWGENLAALDTVINTSGGSWFNTSWKPQLTSPADAAATNFYVNLVRKYGEPGASNDGFTECETAYGEGKAAMWYDATVAAGLIATTYPKVSANTGYAFAPTGSPSGAPGAPSGWLYTWSLSIPTGTPNQAAALKYIEWATGKQYIAYSGPKIGWANIDPGTRTLLITPFLVMPVATALLFKTTIYDPIFGLLDWVLGPFGVHQVNWVGTHSVAAVVAVLVWEWTPFMMLIVLAGLQSESLESLEAARVDGANAVQTFSFITLPYLRPYIELGLLLGSIYLLQTFGEIFVLTQGGGGHGTATTNLPYYIYELAFNQFNVSEAAAAGVIVVIATEIIATLTLRLLSTLFRASEAMG